MQESEMDKAYNPQEFEKRIYKKWIDNKYFHAELNSNKPKFSILMPPPNITGRLHVGHALNHTIPDIVARYKRMMGFNVVYVPGMDHAAIATEDKVVSDLKKKGIQKKDLTREEFNKYIQEWYQLYGGYILDQLKLLGVSADWDRQAFTRDDERNKCVNKAFLQLWNKGLIYRGKRLTNWCPNCNTAISDIEVEYKEEKSKLYYIRYYLENSDKYLIVATTRPETLFGDLAVAVNPNDSRFFEFHNKKVILPIMNIAIPVIVDEYVDTSFGTGALKVTPSHDINDYNLGVKHNLGLKNIMTKTGELNNLCGQFEGLKGKEAREKVVEYLQANGLLEKMEDYVHNVGTCERCHTTVESLVTEQWFVKMKEIVEKTKKSLAENQTSIYPETFIKNLDIWLKDVNDWCISRQLWSGHRIPVYHCDNCANIFIANDKCACPQCCEDDVWQDEDVLDTWFSSGIWPMSTLGWLDDKPEFKEFFPYDLVVTGYDIIFFWIARMLFMSNELVGVNSLKNVVFTGLVRDELGRKMSKNLGNGIDPEEVINEYGADALRLALVYGNTLEGDSRFGNSKIDIARRFVNKVWNAGRFLEMNIDGKVIYTIDKCDLSLADKWILNELNELCKKLSKFMDEFEVGLAITEIYEFVWAKYCDYYIEFSKPNMQNSDLKIANTTASVLKYVYDQILKLLHPYMPFVTEELWNNFNGGTLTFEQYPQYNEKFVFATEEEQMNSIMDLTREIRNIRNKFKVENKKVLNAKLVLRKGKENLEENIVYLEKLTQIKINQVYDNENSYEMNKKDMIVSTPYYTLYLNSEEVVNIEEEKARINKEISKLDVDIDKLQGTLSNAGFVARAPKQVIDKYNFELTNLKDKKEQLLKSLNILM